MASKTIGGIKQTSSKVEPVVKSSHHIDCDGIHRWDIYTLRSFNEEAKNGAIKMYSSSDVQEKKLWTTNKLKKIKSQTWNGIKTQPIHILFNNDQSMGRENQRHQSTTHANEMRSVVCFTISLLIRLSSWNRQQWAHARRNMHPMIDSQPITIDEIMPFDR